MLTNNKTMRGPRIQTYQVSFSRCNRHCGITPADRTGPVTSSSPRCLTQRHCCGSEWWDSPTVLHAPLAPNSHASRTETSLEPVVVCAQSSPTVVVPCVSRVPAEVTARVCRSLRRRRRCVALTSVFPVRFFRCVRV